MSKADSKVLFLILSLVALYYFFSGINSYIAKWQEDHNKNNQGHQWITQQENHTTSWNEITIETNKKTSWDKINVTKSPNKNINQETKKTNKPNKLDDNILWKEEFEKVKKETKYFPEEMDYDTYVANIQYWNEKTNQAQLKILEERNNK